LSPQVPGSRHYDINVRAQFAGHLTDIRHAGLKKISAALKLPPPLEEGRHYKWDKELLQLIKPFATESMSKAAQAAVQVAKSTDITVSGDGTWQTKNFASKHGAAALLSSCPSPKVIDIETCSKTCNVCTEVEIQKIEDINDFVKRLKHTLQVIKHQCGNKKLSDGKPISGKGRNTGNSNK
ncbi:unnamed protein product, partial [Rotaria sp. Silwood2]